MNLNTRPKHPQDMERTQCKDASCLKSHAEKLSGPCAELLLKPSLMPEPSPSPMPRGFGSVFPSSDLVSLLLGREDPTDAAPPMRMRPREPEGMGEGFFQISSSDGEGHTEVMTGPLSAMSGSSLLPPELAQMMEMMPDFSSLFDGLSPVAEETETRPRAPNMPKVAAPKTFRGQDAPEQVRYPTASIGDDPADVAAARKATTSSHPCAEEIFSCRMATGSSATADIKQCLLANFEQLSANCKCFVHQVEGEKVERALPASAKAAAAPIVHSAPDMILIPGNVCCSPSRFTFLPLSSHTRQNIH